MGELAVNYCSCRLCCKSVNNWSLAEKLLFSLNSVCKSGKVACSKLCGHSLAPRTTSRVKLNSLRLIASLMIGRNGKSNTSSKLLRSIHKINEFKEWKPKNQQMTQVIFGNYVLNICWWFSFFGAPLSSIFLTSFPFPKRSTERRKVTGGHHACLRSCFGYSGGCGWWVAWRFCCEMVDHLLFIWGSMFCEQYIWKGRLVATCNTL